MTKKWFISLCVGLVVILGLSIGAVVKSYFVVNRLESRYEQVKQRNDMLELDVIELQKELKTTKTKLTGANQAYEQLWISNQADKLEMEYLVTATNHMASYITYVNIIMEGVGIEIPKFIYGYVDESGNVVK